MRKRARGVSNCSHIGMGKKPLLDIRSTGGNLLYRLWNEYIYDTQNIDKFYQVIKSNNLLVASRKIVGLNLSRVSSSP